MGYVPHTLFGLPKVSQQVAERDERVSAALRMYCAAVMLCFTAFSGLGTFYSLLFFLPGAVCEHPSVVNEDGVNIILDEVTKFLLYSAFVGFIHCFELLSGKDNERFDNVSVVGK
jgi:hypothetical protein